VLSHTNGENETILGRGLDDNSDIEG